MGRNKTLIEKSLGKYRIVEHLGSGGMAEVYKAYHPGLDRYVAIKVLHPFLAGEENFLSRFQREARIVATFRHPNIVQVYDFDIDSDDDAYYMVMELIDGPSLKSRLADMGQDGQKLPVEEAVGIVIALAKALDYAHQHGMLHRDVKPANVMFTNDGQAVLTDFGISRMIDTTTLTASGAMVGTPAYMAPEHAIGRTGDERADIYSLGVVLYQLVTGNLPFEADTPLGVVLQHISAPPTPPTAFNPNLSLCIEAVVMRALAKHPDNRYQTAGEFAADLEKCLAGEHVEPVSSEVVMAPVSPEALTTPNDQNSEQAWRFPTAQRALATPMLQSAPEDRPKRVWLAVLAAALILIVVGTITLFFSRGGRRLLQAFLSSEPTPASVAVASVTPDLTATYNVNATQFASWMATYEATTGVTPTPSPTLTRVPDDTPEPTPTFDLTATALASCVFDMEVIGDPRVWPSVLTPGSRFVKRWVVENTGTCPWPEDVQLVMVGGDELSVVRQAQVEALLPNETAEIQITLRAPVVYDRYTSVWRLQDGEGNPIGEELEVVCSVGPTPTQQPTMTPTVVVTSTPRLTPTPSEPLWMSVPGLVWCDGSRTRGRVEWGRGGGPGDEYRYFFGTISPESELAGPYHSFVGFPHVMTYFTVSGSFSWPLPGDCCFGDYGRYVSPEGYEIVWKKVWHSEDGCR